MFILNERGGCKRNLSGNYFSSLQDICGDFVMDDFQREKAIVQQSPLEAGSNLEM
jgi:hypothetical protein